MSYFNYGRNKQLAQLWTMHKGRAKYILQVSTCVDFSKKKIEMFLDTDTSFEHNWVVQVFGHNYLRRDSVGWQLGR